MTATPMPTPPPTAAKICASHRLMPLRLRFHFRPQSLLGLVIPPQPPQRIGQNGSAVLAAVLAGSPDGFVIVLRKLQRGLHLLVGQKPIAMHIVQIIRSILKENPNRLGRRLANQGR